MDLQREELGYQKVREIENELPELIAKIRSQMAKHIPPKDPETQRLAKRWKELMDMLTAGDLEVSEIIKNDYKDPSPFSDEQLDLQTSEYIATAITLIN